MSLSQSFSLIAVSAKSKDKRNSTCVWIQISRINSQSIIDKFVIKTLEFPGWGGEQ
jgi:hypothetical protein